MTYVAQNRLRLMALLSILSVVAVVWGFRRELTARPHQLRPAPVRAGSSMPAHSARSLVEAARASYTHVPPGDGIVYRRWQIAPDRSTPLWLAEEWVDTANPAHHRMQISQDGALQEWQAGDGRSELRYERTIASPFCGPVPQGLDSHLGEIDSWPMGVQEQADMRRARWVSGVWAIGLRYLDLAAQARSLHVLGMSGSADAAALIVAADGFPSGSRLLLSLDPASLALREVREIRAERGQAEIRTPWKVIADDSTPAQALSANVPDSGSHKLVQRPSGILDRFCPLLGREQVLSLSTTIAMRPGSPVGFGVLPPDTQQALLVGRMDRPALQVVYIAEAKRLAVTVALSGSRARLSTEIAVPPEALEELAPGLIVAHSHGPLGGVDLWAQGWSVDALRHVLPSLRSLRPADWLRTGPVFFEPYPADAPRPARLAPLQAAALRPGRILHRVATVTLRQPGFLPTLHDPYHLPQHAWPPVRRVESWLDVDSYGVVRRWRWTAAGRDGALLGAGWNDGRTAAIYQVLSNTIMPVPVDGGLFGPVDLSGDVDDSDAITRLLASGWTWHELPDGDVEAERIEHIWMQTTESARHIPRSLDRWVEDLDIHRVRERIVFEPGGLLRRSETIVDVPGAPILATTVTDGYDRHVPDPPFRPMTTVVIESSVVNMREWLDTIPEATFRFDPPAGVVRGTHFAGDGAPGSFRLVLSAAMAAGQAPWKVWGWPEPASGFSFRSATVPPGPALVNRSLAQATLDQAVGAGVAVELRYLDASGHPLVMTEGPAQSLPQILRRTAPQWTVSELRSMPLQGARHDVWLMHDELGSRHWAAFELEDTLLLLDYQGTGAGFAAMIGHLDQLRVIPAPRSR